MMYAEKICRVCLSVSDDLTPLWERLPGADKTLEQTIHFVLNINITYEGGLPDKICNDCGTMLDGADTFKQRFLKSEAFLSKLVKEQVTDETRPSFANKSLENIELNSDDASESPALSGSYKVLKKNCENLFDLPEYKIKVEIVEDDLCEESPVSEQENMDVEDSPAIPKEQLLPKEEVHEITGSNMNKRSKDGAWNTDNALKLSDTDNGFTSKVQSKSFGDTKLNNTYEVLTCEICEFTTVQIKYLQSHLKAHAATKRYSCDSCLYLTTNIKHLFAHKKTHTGDKYSCDVCKKKFRKKSALDNHSNTHMWFNHGDKPYSCYASEKKSYSCDVCRKKFKQSSTLTIHMRTHSGEKPYSCHVCTKHFRTKFNLSIHLRTHTGDKPYSCDFCGKNFREKSILNVHFRRHTGDKPYSCDVCRKKFRQSSHLTIHMRTHTGEKPYSCEVCEKRFSDRSAFKRHERTHTGVESQQT